MSQSNPFIGLSNGDKTNLDESDQFPKAGHLWRQSEIDALILAWAARRPLLIRGEAGSGKSQIARAAAAVLNCGDPLVEVIHPRFEATDLLYRFDVVHRLADARSDGIGETNDKYVRNGKLWDAFVKLEKKGQPTPVLLIDEIDKADADLPNSLLEVLGNRSFRVPPLDDKLVHAPSGRMPLIIITTNEERELPAAFVRRCAVLNLNPPKTEPAFINWLVQRGTVHSQIDVAEAEMREVAQLVWQDRTRSIQANYPSVGLAEFIDLLSALHELTVALNSSKRPEKQRYWLKRIRPYALVKGANQEQVPEPMDEAASGQT